MKKIEGSPKNLKQLLQNTKYSIHYYQREYMWQRKHIEELIDDLILFSNKNRPYPVALSNTHNRIIGQVVDCLTETVNHLF